MSFLKVLVIGDVSCGKTSLVNRIVNNVFNESYRATLGCEFGLKVMEVAGNAVRIQLWDLAGQDRLGGISKLYCRDANGALVICDVTNPVTIERAIEWKHQIDEIVRRPDGSAIPIILCVNKYDIVMGTASAPTQAEFDILASRHEFIAAYFTSAKTSYNATEALTHLAKEISTQCKPAASLTGSKLESVVKPKPKKRCC
jgi:small GTP-binding protein